MRTLELEYMMEHELRQSIYSHFPLDWKEDSISHDLAIRLRRRFRRTTLVGTRFPIELDWEFYKLHGKAETQHGDIGLLFRQRLADGSVIEGAGFLEAKIRSRDSTKFCQVRREQNRRILSRSRLTLLLLYDYNAVSVLDSSLVPDADYEFFAHRWSNHGITHARVTHGAVLPLAVAAAIKRYDDTLYRFCYSLSHQFVHRYFQLHDLDFSSRAIKAVKGFPATVGSPSILMVVRSAPVGRELPDPFRPNGDLYAGLE